MTQLLSDEKRNLVWLSLFLGDVFFAFSKTVKNKDSHLTVHKAQKKSGTVLFNFIFQTFSSIEKFHLFYGNPVGKFGSPPPHPQLLKFELIGRLRAINCSFLKQHHLTNLYIFKSWAFLKGQVHEILFG